MKPIFTAHVTAAFLLFMIAVLIWGRFYDDRYAIAALVLAVLMGLATMARAFWERRDG